jgi:hypothetical protein
MFKVTFTKPLIIIIITIISFKYIIYNFYPISLYDVINIQYLESIGGDRRGYISTSLYNQLNSYIASRKNTIGQIQRRFIIKNKTPTSLPLNYEYIQFIRYHNSTIYPYSTWECSNTSNTDENAREYCILTNIFYNSKIDQYYFYQDPSKNQTTTQRNSFKTPYDNLPLNIIYNISALQAPIAAILTQPILVAAPPDLNFVHGFIELSGPQFWVLAECQSHASYINPNKIQIYYTSTMFKIHEPNWNLYEQRSDKTYQPKRQWEQIIQSMFSIYPLLTFKSFNHTTILFQYMLFPSMYNG